MAGSTAIASDISSTDGMTNLKFLCNGESTGKSGTGNSEPSLTLAIGHMFAFSYRLGTSPFTVQFDGKKGKYFMICATWRKVYIRSQFIN